MSTLAVRLGDLITAIGTDYKAIKTMLTGTPGGNLTGLTTTDKTNIVNAINEVNAKPSAVASSTTVAGVAERATDAEALAMSSSIVDLAPSNLAAISNVANGIVRLDGSGKVPSAQLPAYVDDVLEYANLAALPGTGVSGVIYVTADNNKTYRWTGTVYAEISASPGSTDSVTEGTTNLYYTPVRTDARITTLVGDPDTNLVTLYTAAKV